jgi:hypothetical protein
MVNDSKLRAVAHPRNVLQAIGSLLQSGRGPLLAHGRPFRFIGQSFKTLFVAFVLVDLGLILVNVLAVVAQQYGVIDAVPEALRITQDGAIPEDFNYLKWAIIAISLAWLAVRDHWFAPLCWALIFVTILADDSLQLHEQFGAALSSWTGLPSSTYFYADDLGEILAFGAMGLMAFGIAAALYFRSGADGRALSLRYVFVVVALGGFGVGVDAVHQLVSHVSDGTSVATILSQLFGMAEEGGEMIVASFAVAMTLTTGNLRRRPALGMTEETRVHSS